MLEGIFTSLSCTEKITQRSVSLQLNRPSKFSKKLWQQWYSKAHHPAIAEGFGERVLSCWDCTTPLDVEEVRWQAIESLSSMQAAQHKQQMLPLHNSWDVVNSAAALQRYFLPNVWRGRCQSHAILGGPLKAVARSSWLRHPKQAQDRDLEHLQPASHLWYLPYSHGIRPLLTWT